MLFPVDAFLVAQVVVSIALVSAILLQARGTGLSATFGGDSTAYRSRRGLEQTLFRLTIILAGAFVAISLLIVVRGAS